MEKIKVGEISEAVIQTLGLDVKNNTPVFLGESNINHMKSKHPSEYDKYSPFVTQIINSPDYVGVNPKDSSIEYVKEFKLNSEYVKVAVRVSSNNVFYARSIYVLQDSRVNNFIKKGTLKPLTNI